MLRYLIIFLTLIGILAALWPNTTSLYGFTGEEEFDGQLVGLIHWVNTVVRPQPRLAPNAEMSHVDVPVAGMNTPSNQNEAEPWKRDETIRIVSEAGFHFVRQEFTWEDIEIAGKGDFEDTRNIALDGGISAWTKYDHLVEVAEKYDVELIVRLSNPPEWTRAKGDAMGEAAPPDDFTDFGDFAEAVATRYGDRLTYYQLWNEPNLHKEWGEQPISPERYTELLCEGYNRIKAVNPNAIILSGAVAQTIENLDDYRWWLTYYNMNDLVFLTRMYRAGAADCFDILSVQAYGLNSGAMDKRLLPTTINVNRLTFYRDVMVRYGDAEKSMWVSEAGWNSVPDDGSEAVYGRVDEQTKGRYAAELLGRAEESWPYVGVVNLWYIRDREPKDDPSYHFRYMEPDFTPLESWEIVSEFTQSLETESIEAKTVRESRWRPVLLITSVALLFFTILQNGYAFSDNSH